MSRVRLMIRDQCWSALWRAGEFITTPLLWLAMQAARLMVRIGHCLDAARAALAASMIHVDDEDA